jgi:uncharacterized membrane protein
MKFKRTFWDGIKAFVPIALTVGIVLWLFSSLESFFGHLIQYAIPKEYYFKGLGILLGIIFIYCMGLLVNAWMVKWVYDLAERVVQQIPGVKTIYNAIQDLVNFFDKSDKSDQQQAVLIDWPIGKVMGFVTRSSMAGTPLAEHGGEDEVLVYIPLSYQIGGLAVMVSRKSLTPLKWPADQAMSFILTAGMTTQRK